MDKFLYSENNINNQTKRLVKILNININNNPETIQIVKKCKNIINNTMIEVYNKYGYQLEPNMVNAEKLNNKCISNCIKKIQNKSQVLENFSQEDNYPQNNYQQTAYSHPEQQRNPSQNLEAYTGGSGGNYASLSGMPMTGGIMNAMGGNGMIDVSSKNGTLKREGRDEIMRRLENLKQETTDYYKPAQPQIPDSTNQMDVTAWLNLGGGNNNSSQASYTPNQNFNQQQPMQQQSPPQQQQQIPPQQQSIISYQPSNNNMGSSFDEAYKGITPTTMQNTMINETDTSKRLEMLTQSRSSIDSEISKFQTGKGFDPMKSANEYNKGLFF